jgi:hypothetical protein
MSKIRIGSKVDEATWNKLKALAADTRRNISDLLTEAIRKYITRKRARPVALNHLELSIAENETPANALPGERVAFLRQNEVLAIHCTLLECLGDHAKKTGFGTTGPNPCFRLISDCSGGAPEQAYGLPQIKAIVLHHLGPCRNEVIDELVLRIIGCIDFSNGTQFRV